MFNRPRRIGPVLRLALARRPWLRWSLIAVAAVAAGWGVERRLQTVDDARAAWTDRRTVLVATDDHQPGDRLVAEFTSLPEIAIPPAALAEIVDGAVVRQRISQGEIVTGADVASGDGPAAAARAGQVVVAVSDPLLTTAMARVTVGLRVAVHSEGIVLAHDARITAVEGDVVFIALDPDDATAVSAAAQMRLASIAFVR